ncbi:MAG: hypothetical protein EHM93_10495 [Bacteroidales bacterium]|nr:MAG: hypothetical protein EHM93_10495 [Bacteroidales bacterium]
MKHLLSPLPLLAITVLLLINCSCEKSETGDDESSPNSNKGLIRDKYDAGRVADAFNSFVANIEDNTSTQATYTSHVLTSASEGTATITGTKSKETISSYTTCYKSRLTITFNNYQYQSYKVTGTINYKQDRYTSSSYHLIKQVDGNGLKVEVPNGEYSISDVVTILLQDKNDNQYILTGNVTSSNGTLYGANGN